jgi:hypothetical protein
MPRECGNGVQHLDAVPRALRSSSRHGVSVSAARRTTLATDAA